jgi:integrase/recombinase XerD
VTETKRPRGRPKGTTRGDETHVLSHAQQDQLFRAAHRRGVREEFFLRLVYVVALRVKEAVELRLDAFDTEAKEVKVRGCKAGRVRSYALPPAVWRLYEAWLKERPAEATNPYVFPHRFRPDDHLTREGGKAIFRNVARDAGIKGHSIHSLRHSCAQDMANAGDPQVMIAGHLRHRSVSSSDRYIDTSLNEAYSAVVADRLERRWRKR